VADVKAQGSRGPVCGSGGRLDVLSNLLDKGSGHAISWTPCVPDTLDNFLLTEEDSLQETDTTELMVLGEEYSWDAAIAEGLRIRLRNGR
jgi:hypothetical protein